MTQPPILCLTAHPAHTPASHTIQGLPETAELLADTKAPRQETDTVNNHERINFKDDEAASAGGQACLRRQFGREGACNHSRERLSRTHQETAPRRSRRRRHLL